MPGGDRFSISALLDEAENASAQNTLLATMSSVF